MNHLNTPRPTGGFSLIELIVVITIIVIIAGFTVPAATSIMKGSQLTTAAQVVQDQLSVARQTAMSRNRPVEVRFYRFGDPEIPGEEAAKPRSGRFRALQVFEVSEAGGATAVSKVYRMPGAIVMDGGSSSKLSSLLSEDGGWKERDASSDAKAPELPRVKRSYQYFAFQFRPDGSTNLSPVKQGGGWFVTVLSSSEPGDKKEGRDTPPANFFTLQIDPVSGTVKTFRPSV